jgi:hypothetical protein
MQGAHDPTPYKKKPPRNGCILCVCAAVHGLRRSKRAKCCRRGLSCLTTSTSRRCCMYRHMPHHPTTTAPCCAMLPTITQSWTSSSSKVGGWQLKWVGCSTPEGTAIRVVSGALDSHLVHLHACCAGAPDGVHDRVEIIDATSSRIWRGAVEELSEVTPGRWRPQPPRAQQQQQQWQIKQELCQEANAALPGDGHNKKQQQLQQDGGDSAAAGDEDMQETEETGDEDEEQWQQQGTHMQLRVRCKTSAHGSARVNKRGADHQRKNPCPQRSKTAATATKPAAAVKTAARLELQQCRPLVSGPCCTAVPTAVVQLFACQHRQVWAALVASTHHPAVVMQCVGCD